MTQDERRRLEDLLDREIALAQSLAATLAAEQLALTGQSPAAVEQNAAEKIRVIESIEKLEEERRTLCAGPLSADIAATVAQRWGALMELMARCFRSVRMRSGRIGGAPPWSESLHRPSPGPAGWSS